jgi:hypothetical protein
VGLGLRGEWCVGQATQRAEDFEEMQGIAAMIYAKSACEQP